MTLTVFNIKEFSQHAPQKPKNAINAITPPTANMANEAVRRLMSANVEAPSKSSFHLTRRTPIYIIPPPSSYN